MRLIDLFLFVNSKYPEMLHKKPLILKISHTTEQNFMFLHILQRGNNNNLVK